MGRISPEWIRTKLRNLLVELRVASLRKVWGMEIGRGTRVSLKAHVDKTNPKGVHIGSYTGVGAHAIILSHDFIGATRRDTRIGSNCHIGMAAIILPGITIGDSCIVAPGSVVMKDVPTGSLVAGNPARLIEKDLVLGPWGIRNWKHGEQAEGTANG